MSPFQKVIIIGAGPAGLAAALLLQQRNHPPSTVYEASPSPTTLGGSISIPSNGLRLLDHLGIYSSLIKCASTGSKTILHGRHGEELGEIDLVAPSTEAQTGYGYMRVKRTDLVNMLLEKIKERSGIQVEWGKRVVSVQEDEDGVRVSFQDGTTDTSDLLLGCDGIHSAVRTTYVDPAAVPLYSGISTIFAFLSLKDLPETSTNMACTHVTFTEDGLFVVGPCTADGDTLFWFFSNEVAVPETNYESDREGWKEHRRTVVEGFNAKLLSILKDVRGDWGLILKNMARQTTAVNFYPIFRLPLGRQWYRGRCILLGDAGHVMPPHSGQGVSMALEDVFLLSRLLGPPTAALSDVFEKFVKVRRPRIEKFYKIAAENGNERRKSSSWVLWLREIFLWCVLSVFASLNLQRWRFGQKDLIYDIDQVEI
ncbi:hypothetical protein OIDMADRAFT_106437 [Oidiodendron maius Zn]|uniref:FAD-binding domain-containing protein n=1 Tax=Oidiodendron maius (strain Zn) TaxID=913774 RepID=A0A0C3GH14_OIDMZ|nr:hypothetical protein OIDMADRAFT_106437 [Oidiodendron maius Zn]